MSLFFKQARETWTDIQAGKRYIYITWNNDNDDFKKINP